MPGEEGFEAAGDSVVHALFGLVSACRGPGQDSKEDRHAVERSEEQEEKGVGQVYGPSGVLAETTSLQMRGVGSKHFHWICPNCSIMRPPPRASMPAS